MIASELHNTLSFAAMPIQAVIDDNAHFAGFTMQRVQQSYLIHQLYNETDRKNYFPTADYRFLVRAAHNLAQAFTHLHYENLVIGDVNESGIFFSTGGWVKLIDCDSFQAELGSKFYPCLVRVPEYTPGELHGQDTSKIRRTANHDNFALAVMIFRLLMFGQHPYTALYKGRGDSPTQASRVKNFEYAYDRSTKNKNFGPPLHALDITSFPDTIISAFETAFGPQGAQYRPTAAEWSTLLQNFDQALVACRDDPTHHHLSAFSTCPICRAENRMGTTFFRRKTRQTTAGATAQSNHSPMPPASPPRRPLPINPASIFNSKSAFFAIAILCIVGITSKALDDMNWWSNSSDNPKPVLDETLLSKEYGEDWKHVREVPSLARAFKDDWEKVFISNIEPLVRVGNSVGVIFVTDQYDLMSQDENGLYFEENTNITITKYDVDGSFEWQQELPGIDGTVYSFAYIEPNIFLLLMDGLNRVVLYNRAKNIVSESSFKGYLRLVRSDDDGNIQVVSQQVETPPEIDSNNMHRMVHQFLQTSIDSNTGIAISPPKVVWSGEFKFPIVNGELTVTGWDSIFPIFHNQEEGYILLARSGSDNRFDFDAYFFDDDGNLTDKVGVIRQTKPNEHIRAFDSNINNKGYLEAIGSRVYGNRSGRLHQIWFSRVDLNQKVTSAAISYFGPKFDNSIGTWEQGLELTKVREYDGKYYVEYKSYDPGKYDDELKATAGLLDISRNTITKLHNIEKYIGRYGVYDKSGFWIYDQKENENNNSYETIITKVSNIDEIDSLSEFEN